MIFARLLRFAFHLLYHPFAWTYDAVAAVVSAGLWQRWVASAAGELDGCERILEVGHGPGHLLEDLYASRPRAVGVDLSPQMGRLARKRLLAHDRAPLLVRADGRRLPFPAKSFDAVVATFPAEYIAEVETWRAFRRVLADDGRIVVLLGARPLGKGPLRLASRALFRVTQQDSAPNVARMREQLERFLASAGLEGELLRVDLGHSETFLLAAHRQPAV